MRAHVREIYKPLKITTYRISDYHGLYSYFTNGLSFFISRILISQMTAVDHIFVITCEIVQDFIQFQDKQRIGLFHELSLYQQMKYKSLENFHLYTVYGILEPCLHS